MKSAVGDLASAGLEVGVLIDPLASKGEGAGTAKSADGLTWLNPVAPEAKEALAAKIKTLKDWDAAFVVVDYSAIPDETLVGFGVTRAEAQNLAYKALREAADPLPVFPSSVSSVTDGLDAWLDASSSVARMAVYGMTPGPLCCTLSDGSKITPELMMAAQFWPGPIEFRGTLSNKIEGDVRKMLAMERLAAHPLDAGLDAPRTWRYQRHDEAGAVVEDRTMVVGQISGVTSAAELIKNQAPASDAAKAQAPEAEKAETDEAKEDAAKAEAKAAAKAEAKAAKGSAKAQKAEAEKAEAEKAEAERAEAEKSAEASAEPTAPKEASAAEEMTAEETANTETAKAEPSDSDTDPESEGGLKKKLKRVWPF
jgi:hypothetical protein